MSADATTARLAGDYLLWFIPAMASTVRDGGDGRGAARHGQLQTGHDGVSRRPSSSTCSLAPVLIFGWGTGFAAGRAGAALATFHRGRPSAWSWITIYFIARERVSAVSSGQWKPRPPWREYAEDRPPGGRRVRADGGLLVSSTRSARPFGAAAQAGFGIGMRVVPVVLHAGGGARLRRRARRGTELRRPPGRRAYAHVHRRGVAMAAGSMCQPPSSMQSRAAGDDAVSSRPTRRRLPWRGVPAHRCW